MPPNSHKRAQFNALSVNGVRLGFTHKGYWCTICKSKLVYLNHTNTIWRCDNCLSYYDTKIQDRPVKDKSEFKLRSYHDPYTQFDEDDPNIVFVEGINIEAREQGGDGVEIIRSSTADKRI